MLYLNQQSRSKQIPILTENRKTAFDALSNALVFYKEFGGEDHKDLIELQDSLKEAVNAIEFSRNGITNFSETVINLPRMTKELNKGKRKVVDQLSLLLNEINTTEHTMGNIIESINKMINI